MAKLVIRHDLHTLSAPELQQYLRDVSEFIGLDPDLNALDAIWMPNESGVGQSLVVYMRRGTAEILRNKLGIEVDELTHQMVNGSIVFTAKGHTKKDGRTEQAIGSKYITGLTGKLLDDAIMTASTRALRRLTAQFTTLGLLDESEVQAAQHAPTTAANPAGEAGLSTNSLPPVFSQPTVQANDAPGKPVALNAPQMAVPGASVPPAEAFQSNPETKADIKADISEPEKTVTTEESATSKPKPRGKRRSVSLEVEPEAVSTPVAHAAPPAPVPTQVNSAVPKQAFDAGGPPNVAPYSPEQAARIAIDPVVYQVAKELGYPSKEQMDSYRARISVFTQQLPASEGMGSVQKMRAFMTKLNKVPPQQMTVDQYEATIKFLEEFAARDGVPGLITHINAFLGVK